MRASNRTLIIFAAALIGIAIIAGLIFQSRRNNSSREDIFANTIHALRLGSTLTPLHLIVQELTRGITVPTLIIPPPQGQANPSSNPKNILNNYDIIFTSGTMLDAWVGQSSNPLSSTSSHVIMVNVAEKIPLLSGDPYYWLDVENVKIVTETIRAILISSEPAYEAALAYNASAFKEQLTMIDRDIKERVQGFDKKPIVAEYPFLSYVSQRYGFTVHGTLGMGPHDSYHTSRLTTLAHSMRTQGISSVLVTPDAPSWVSEFASTHGFTLYTFNPMLIASSTLNASYQTIMRHNIESLSDIFHYTPPKK